MSQKEIDQYIQSLAEAITQQQGIQFNSLKEANAHAQKTSNEIRNLLQQSTVMLKEGLQIFSERCTGFVAEVSKKLLAQVNSPEEINKIIETEIKNNEHALKMFSEASNSFYNCGDFHVEQCVLSVYLMLFPLYPQPYACYATLIWRKDGIAAAEALYTQLVGFMEDPVLDYFAADCFVKAGNASQARELVQRALVKIDSAADEHRDLKQHLLQLARRCG